MSDSAILIWSYYPTQFPLPSKVHKLIDGLLPGDRLDFDEIPENLKNEFLDEFYGRNYLLSSGGIVGIVEECFACEGTAVQQGKKCSYCDGLSLLVSQGNGWVPYRE